MRFAKKNGQICFSLRKFFAISSAIQRIAGDCGCDAVVPFGQQLRISGWSELNEASARSVSQNLQFHLSAPAQRQQLQRKQTSDATSLWRLCCRASFCHSGKGTLDVASRGPRDEGRSCRCRPFVRFPNSMILIIMLQESHI